MHWHEHSENQGKHALFSPSNPAYFGLEAEEFRNRLNQKLRSAVGTEIHEWCFFRIIELEKVGSAREALKGIKGHIFKKYYIEKFRRLSIDGIRLINTLSVLSKEVFETAKVYVNDAISFRMDPEVILQVSPRTFGTADAISFNGSILRIHDLKTGVKQARIDQLVGYDAYFCIEYNIDPCSIEHELRVYQNNDILIATPTGDEIKPLMDKIIMFDMIQKEFEEG